MEAGWLGVQRQRGKGTAVCWPSFLAELPWRGLGSQQDQGHGAHGRWVWRGAVTQNCLSVGFEIESRRAGCPACLVFWPLELLPDKSTAAPYPNLSFPLCPLLCSALWCCSRGRVMVVPSSFPALSPAPASPDTSFPFSPPLPRQKAPISASFS